MVTKSGIFLGICLALIVSTANASCCGRTYATTYYYEVVERCGYCCYSPCVIVEEYEYYSSPHRHGNQRGVGQMEEYAWVP